MSQQPLDNGKKIEGSGRKLAAFISIGNKIIHYDVDVENATMVERELTAIEENVQYAWPHISGDYLYVASSNGGPGGSGDNRHFLTALKIDPVTRILRPHGERRTLPYRPVHIMTDRDSKFALVAHSSPSGLTIQHLNKDGTLGDVVPQQKSFEFGNYPHQVYVTPSNKTVLLITRGHDAANGKHEDPGAIKVFDFQYGMLSARATIAPNEGYGFGPRHIDIYPGQPWVFVSQERQNRLTVFKLDEQERLSDRAIFEKEALIDPTTIRPRQMVGAIHIHPNGNYVYIANRALGMTEFKGNQVSVGGETSIAVFAINQATGEPTKIQDMDAHGAHPRTFAIDPTGKLLIAANSTPLVTRNGDEVIVQPANLALFRIVDNGRLEFIRKYDIPTHGRDIFWMCILS